MAKTQTAHAPSGDAAQTAPTADGASLPNATPQMIAADEFDAAWRADQTAIRVSLREIDTITAGDINGTAYIKAKSTLGKLQVPLSTMVLWYPGSTDDPIEKRIVAAHNELQPETSVAAYSLLSRIMRTAVAASDPAIAKDARMGESTDEAKPQFKYVQLRALVDKSVPADKRPKGAYEGTQADAKAEFDIELSRAKAAGDADSAMAWENGKEAINNIVKLRRLGNDLAALGMQRNRWRRILYVQAAQQYLDDYTASKPITPVGKVWRDAVGMAMAAHKSYVNENGPKGTATVEGLATAIKTAVWDNFLAKKIEVQGKRQISEDEAKKNAIKALWKALDTVDQIFTVTLAEQVETYRSRTLTQFLPDVAEELKRPRVKAAERRAAEDREAEVRAQADAQAAGEADTQAQAEATTERQKARAQQREAAMPTRREVTKPATPASDRMSRVKRPAAGAA